MFVDGVLGPSCISLEDEEFHELPYPTMLGKAPASPRNSSKRFACDRCRGQKLRCVRDDKKHETCIRCLRMNAVCITNSPLRMGRPRRAETERRRRRTLEADGQTLIMTSDDQVLEMETGIGAASKPSWMPNAIPEELGPSDANPNDGSTSTNNISNNTCPSLESSDLPSWQAQGSESMGSIHETLGLADPGNRALSESNSVGDGSKSILNWPSPSLDTTDVFADLTNGVSLSEEVFLASLQPPASRPPTSPTNSAEMASPGRSGSENSHDFLNGCPALSDFAVPERSQIHQYGTKTDTTTSTESEKSPEKDCIHLLSELSLSLYRQLLRFNSNTLSPPLVPLTRCGTNASMDDPNLIGNILHSSEEFLTLINGLLSSLHEPSESLPANVASFIPENFHHESRDPHKRNINFYTQSLMKTSSPSFGFSLSACSSAGTGNLSSRPKQGLVGNKTAASFLSKPDTPVILLVITCYVQLIRIYSMIFSHVHRSLLATVSGHTPSLLDLPDFQISGFPLRSGILQVKILIEVVVHFLNHIEKVLGLPMEYRVSSRDGRSTGMLSDLDLTELFKMVIKQEERGEVKSLREHIKCMKNLLENC